MDAVHPDKDIRNEAKACEQETSTFVTSLALNPDLYRAFSNVETKNLDADTQRLVTKTLREYRRQVSTKVK